MQTMRGRVAASLIVLAVAGCTGGGTAPSLPPPGGPVPDAAARAATQGALLAEQAAIVLFPAAGGPSYLAVRRTQTARAPRAGVPCNNGFSEQAPPTGPVVESLFFDAACASLRQTITISRTVGVDTSGATGTIVSYDGIGRITAVQGLGANTFASGGGFVTRRTTDASGSGATPFGRTTLHCTGSAAQCTLAAVADGAAFENGVLLRANVPVSPTGSTVTVPFTGSLSTGTPGTMSIAQQPPQPPTLTGGTPLGTLGGSLTITPGIDWPGAFTVALDAGSVHVAGSMANGITTFAVSGGATATVNPNGDGTMRYASGAVEPILDYRITS